jgi:hypothetical protein
MHREGEGGKAFQSKGHFSYLGLEIKQTAICGGLNPNISELLIDNKLIVR